METKRKAVLLGDNINAQYHPMHAIEQELVEVFHDQVNITSTEDREILSADGLQPFDLCIAYTDSWRIQVMPSQVAGLLNYVSGGGGLLVIHNGISLQARFELSQMIGAKFTGHPPYGPLEFHPTSTEHEILQGIEAFTMEEEPYRFDVDSFTETTVLLEYAHEGGRWPAAWAHDYGLGRVVYLMPGHHVQSFRHDMYRKLMVQSGLWACRKTKGQNF